MTRVENHILLLFVVCGFLAIWPLVVVLQLCDLPSGRVYVLDAVRSCLAIGVIQFDPANPRFHSVERQRLYNHALNGPDDIAKARSVLGMTLYAASIKPISEFGNRGLSSVHVAFVPVALIKAVSISLLAAGAGAFLWRRSFGIGQKAVHPLK